VAGAHLRNAGHQTYERDRPLGREPKARRCARALPVVSALASVRHLLPFPTRVIETDIEEINMDRTISTKDLKSKLDQKQGIMVVETLAPERYREAHIPGALNIPPERIKELAPQLLPNKDAEIIAYCANTH
jgi:hypothetical protein